MFHLALFVLPALLCAGVNGLRTSTSRTAANTARMATLEANLAELQTATNGLALTIDELQATLDAQSTQNEMLKDQIADLIIAKNAQLEARLQLIVENMTLNSEILERNLTEKIEMLEETFEERIEFQEYENEVMEEYIGQTVKEQSTKNQELEHYLFLKNSVEGLKTQLAKYKALENSTALATTTAAPAKKPSKLDKLFAESFGTAELEE